MDLLSSILLGIVQGITEWLPVSSKGNVAILAQFLGLSTGDAFSYAILLHVGTLIAAAIYFRKEIMQILRGNANLTRSFIIWTLIFTAVTAIPCYILLKKILDTASINLFGLIIYSQTIFVFVVGLFLLITGILQLAKKKERKAELTKKNAIFLGLAQGLTVLPGMSRSGTTTSVMLFEGFSPEKAFHLSFLISVPAVILGELSFNLLEKPILTFDMIYGVIAAGIVGYFSIGFLLNIAKKINFGKFCIALAIVYFAIAGISVLAPLVA